MHFFHALARPQPGTGPCSRLSIRRTAARRGAPSQRIAFGDSWAATGTLIVIFAGFFSQAAFR
jgi:hypothetical protein